jgi:hypothetical protein
MQSREGLYDDKYMLTASSYELEHYPSEVQSPQAVVLSSEKQQHRLSRDATESIITITAQKPQKKKGLSMFTGMDRSLHSASSRSERKLQSSAGQSEWGIDSNNMTSSVTTEIDNRGTVVKPEGKPTPKWEIGVETTVCQTYHSTYMSTAVRC